MILSLEKEIKKFSKLKSPLVGGTILKPKMDIIIPKTGSQYLKPNQFNTIKAGESIHFSELKNLINNSGEYHLNDFARDFKNWFWDKDFEVINKPYIAKFKSGDIKLAAIILDNLLTEEGLTDKVSRSSWYYEGSTIEVVSISSTGIMKVENCHKSKFMHLNFYGDDLIYANKVVHKNKVDMLKDLGLYDKLVNEILNYRDEETTFVDIELDVDNYYNNHSITFVAKLKKNSMVSYMDERYTINYGIVIPGSLTNGNRDVLIDWDLVLKPEQFIGICNDLIIQKKIKKEFRNELFISNLASIKKEQTLWFTDSGKIMEVELLPDEIDIIEKIINTINFRFKKNTTINWNTLEEIFTKLSDYYSDFNRGNTYVPSAPNTSTFTATKSGWVKFDKDFRSGESYYSRGTYFKYGLKIGGNYNYGRPGSVLLYILKFIQKYFGFPTYSSGEKISIGRTSGTNWSAIGIG